MGVILRNLLWPGISTSSLLNSRIFAQFFKYIYQKYIYFWLIDILFSEVYTAVTIRNIYKLELDC